jgi:hypothetical protein
VRKKKLLILAAIILFVPILSIVFRQEVPFLTAPPNDSKCNLQIYVTPTPDRPGGGFCPELTGTAYGWPSKFFAVASWKYPADPTVVFDSNSPSKTAYRWKFYPEGFGADLLVMTLTTLPLLAYMYEKRKAE